MLTGEIDRQPRLKFNRDISDSLDTIDCSCLPVGFTKTSLLSRDVTSGRLQNRSRLNGIN